MESETNTITSNDNTTVTPASTEMKEKESKKPVFLSKETVNCVVTSCANTTVYVMEVLRVKKACDSYNESDAGRDDPVEQPKQLNDIEERLCKARTNAIDTLHKEPCVSILYLSISMYRDYKRKEEGATEEELLQYDEVYRRCRKQTSTMKDFAICCTCVSKAKKERWIQHEFIKDVKTLLTFAANFTVENLITGIKALESVRKEEEEFLESALQQIKLSLDADKNPISSEHAS